MRKVSQSRSIAARKGWATRSERDEAVVVNLDPSTVLLWKRTRAAIKGASAHERAERFAEYCEENPRDVIDALQDHADREVARMIAQHVREDRELARAAGDADPDADDVDPDADDADTIPIFRLPADTHDTIPIFNPNP